MTAIAQFIQGLGPAVAAGALTAEAGQQMLLTTVRKFKLGREVEDLLDDMQENPPQDGEGEAEAQQTKLDLQVKQAESKARIQEIQEKRQFEQQKHQNEMEKLTAERQVDEQKFQQQIAVIRAKNEEV